ncbi:glycosyl transferase [Salmonella enterica subsp. enterica serovar Choleraesuis]|nr:glycosyl transferase [Salmonella enterica subsp. enterica serovar Choleraesuis]
MKILYVNKFFFIKGGAETVLFQEREASARAGYQIIDFSMQHPENAPSAWSDYFVHNVDYHGSHSLWDKLRAGKDFIYNSRACEKFNALLLHEQPDIVHFHNIYHQLTPALIGVAKRFGCKTVLTAHDYKIVCPSYTMLRDGKVCDDCLTGTVFNAYRHRCQEGERGKSLLLSLEALWQNIAQHYAMLDVIVAPSEFMRQTLLRKLPNSRIEVIVNGIDTSATAPGETVGDYFLYFGRLSREKGVATLAEAHLKMQERMPLKIAGHGPLYDDLRARYSKPEFLGYQQQGDGLNALIRNARAVIVPSEYYENCSMSVLEAMAFGRPVVGGNIGGIPEQIRDGLDGRLFTPGDADALAHTLDEFVRNPQQAREMGLSARKRLEDKYSLSQHMQTLQALYLQLNGQTS